MKTTYKVIEDNAGMFHIFAQDETGEMFAYSCQDVNSAIGLGYELVNGATAAELDEEYGSDVDEEAFFADFEEDFNYRIILDEKGKYFNDGFAAGQDLLTALFYEEALSYELERMSDADIIPPALSDENRETQFQSLFNVGAYACPDGFSFGDFERFVEKIGRLTRTVESIDISENEDKLEISLHLRREKYANTAVISETIRHWFTSDAAWRLVSYEQDGAVEFLALEKI